MGSAEHRLFSVGSIFNLKAVLVSLQSASVVVLYRFALCRFI